MKEIVAKYQIVVYDDYSVEVCPLPDQDQAAHTVSHSTPASASVAEPSIRVRQVVSVVREVCRELSNVSPSSMSQVSFKKIVAQAVKTTAKQFKVEPPTILDKLTRKCGLRMEQFTNLLYEFLSHTEFCVENHEFWLRVFDNCSPADLAYAATELNALRKSIRQ